MATEDRVIVGIDFGTTHSAVAWAHTSSPDEYEVLTKWPGQSGKDWGKVPSDIAYYVPNPSPSPAASVVSVASSSLQPPDGTPAYKWGFEVSHNDMNRLSWIKILLDPSQPRPQFVNPKATKLPFKKKPVDIVTDYLTALKNYTMQTLERRFGREWLYGDEGKGVSARKVEFVLTVPAVWSDKARQTTLEAAVRAGLGLFPGTQSVDDSQTNLGLLRLITEPEGAAEYALRTMEEAHTMNVGDCFVVCDAGGGTVDLISYSIRSLDPLSLDECVVGSGALCGAVYLDRRFEDFVIKRIGKDTYDSISDRSKVQMNQYWETYMKREYNELTEEEEENAQDFFVPLPGVPDNEENGVSEGFLKVTREEVKEIFEPIVTQVIDLIKDQVVAVLKEKAGPISAILLVGGFGSSEYLFNRIEKWAEGKFQIIQPRNAWTAVVRGAIIRGLQGDISAVQSRRSRQYYGVVHDSKYDETKHSESEKKWHELRREWVVKNRMQWYIKRGDITVEQKKISFPFYRTINVDDVVGDSHQLRTELWVCDLEVAPDKRDSTVRKLCVMTSEPVPVSRFSKHTNEAGKEFYRVDYSLDMTVTSGLVVYEMSLEGQEQSVGRVTTKYE